MSLRFFFGPSGAGKSRRLYQEVIARSLQEPDRNFLIIVPDQFTMQTQKELVTLHERGGILNIDVLSFGRLSHRVLEEVGELDTPVLDDTGKSLVLQKVALGLSGELPTLGGYLQRQGYIHEVKSAISEFMQYGIGVEDMDTLIAFAGKRGALARKLKDLAVLYGGFKEYIQGKFLTTEETMDVLGRSLPRASLVQDAVVVFDGFTGFTPIQNKVIQQIMRLSAETVVSLTLGEGEDPYHMDGEQKLFHMTKKTVHDLLKLAGEAGVARGEDVFCRPGDQDRFAESPALRFLEQNLFRFSQRTFADPQDSIRIFSASSPREEVHQAGLMTLTLVRERGLAFRDVAMIVGDLESYAPLLETEFAQMEIPCYVDRTRGIEMNPMIECINSALQLFQKDFTYEAVFHYLRCGMSDIPAEEVDALEDYVLKTGIRGYRRWSRSFVRKTEEMGEDEEQLLRLNRTRELFLAQVESLHVKSGETVGFFVERLYAFLCENRVQEKLEGFGKMFAQQKDPGREREYAQIYPLVIDLLDQIYALLGDERISYNDFAEILKAGFGETQVGTIPQNVDRVVVGDMERTRLGQVKALFFLGVNDGNIPKGVSKGGIISDMDREFLRESELELAPSPRQQMYNQRLYLYLNMTKPSHYLVLSFSKVNTAGKSITPAYLVDVVQGLFPELSVEYPQNRPVLEQVVTPKEGVRYLAEGLRDYARGLRESAQGVQSGTKQLSDGETAFFTLYAAFGETPEQLQLREELTKAAFYRYRDSALSRAVARALYGMNLENSVSRLETYAACAYRHFLQYGLSLREREEFGFERVDMGNVFHAVLEQFSRRLGESAYTWFDFPEEFGEREVGEALRAYAAEYGETILYSSARNEYAITRMGRVLTRTVLTLQEQLKRGEFVPDAYEVSFHSAKNLESVNVALSSEEKMRLQGRIDRIDIAEDEGKVYVKVIDYKSGDRQFDLAALYYGLQLQLVVYMNAAVELEAGRHPDKEVVPAAMLYYHIQDPTVETQTELAPEEINARILEELRMKGVVNEEESVVRRLDQTMEGKSMVIPVERKKDGSFSARSSVLSGEELSYLSDYVNCKIRDIGREILSGKVSLNPYVKGSGDSCTYCAYQKVCGFDPSIGGFVKRELEDMDKETALAGMKEVVDRERAGVSDTDAVELSDGRKQDERGRRGTKWQ